LGTLNIIHFEIHLIFIAAHMLL